MHIQKKILTRNELYIRDTNTKYVRHVARKEIVQHLGDNIAEGPCIFLVLNKSAARGRQL